MEEKIKELKDEIEKDYLINHFTLECNKCGSREILINLDEDFFKEIKFDCFKCKNTFTIDLEGFNQGILSNQQEIIKMLDKLGWDKLKEEATYYPNDLDKSVYVNMETIKDFIKSKISEGK